MSVLKHSHLKYYNYIIIIPDRFNDGAGTTRGLVDDSCGERSLSGLEVSFIIEVLPLK